MKVLVVSYDGDNYVAKVRETENPHSTNPLDFGLSHENDIIAVIQQWFAEDPGNELKVWTAGSLQEDLYS